MLWYFRPSALSSVNYATMTADQLYELYMKDNERASKERVQVPSLPTSGILRTCQWNVHHFAPTEQVSDPFRLAVDIADRVLETNADVIVLNEFGIEPEGCTDCRIPSDCCRERLEQHGYTVHIASCFFPTAVATRLPLAGPIRKLDLDFERAAVAVPLDTTSNDSTVREAIQSPLWIYGTHLEASNSQNGAYRREEIQRLLEMMQKLHPNLGNAKAAIQPRIMIIGDFNQQRAEDYTAQEWQQICGSKQRRQSPLDDGVSSMLKETGFQCVFDSVLPIRKNWPNNTPPPSTHWSGTLIDYTYFRGPGLRLNGVYVSSCSLSDHRMVLCDWVVS
jgi:endonuclease/exonuclease/phosphatase family metal-dependent hydrolase